MALRHGERRHSNPRQASDPGFEAEYGQSTGGVVNVISKSGSNQFTGKVTRVNTSNVRAPTQQHLSFFVQIPCTPLTSPWTGTVELRLNALA